MRFKVLTGQTFLMNQFPTRGFCSHFPFPCEQSRRIMGGDALPGVTRQTGNPAPSLQFQARPPREELAHLVSGGDDIVGQGL